MLAKRILDMALLPPFRQLSNITVSSMKSFGTRAWRKRMGLTREQAAERLGLSVYTIKSYEIGQRQVPIPTRRLMARLEGEQGEASAGQPGACVIGGGGSTGSGKRGVDLVARPSADIPKLASAILSAHDIPARVVLTSEQDPSSNTRTDQDLVNLAQNLVQDPDIFTIIWGAWTAGEAMGNAQATEAVAIDQALQHRPLNQCLIRISTLLSGSNQPLGNEELLAEARRVSKACRADISIVHDGQRATLWCESRAESRTDTDLELILATGVAIALELDDVSRVEPDVEVVGKVKSTNTTHNLVGHH